MTDKKFGACILAAGFSSRMGSFKPLLPLGDKTVIERVLRVSNGVGIGEIVVVTGHNREALFPVIKREKAKEVFNPDFKRGMFTSIQAGTAALSIDLDGFFIMPVDCPLVTEDVLRVLMCHFQADKFAVPCYRGKKGHPLLVPACFRQEIISHDGKNGLKAITDREPEKMERIAVEHEGVVMDMDTPQSYEELKEYLERGYKSESLIELAAGRRFFLIRHGQIQQHKEKIFLGQTDAPLSEEGKKQAASAGRKLMDYELRTERLYSSDLSRASQSAGIIGSCLGISKLVPLPGLREMNLGPWDGKFISEIKRKLPQEYEKRGRDIMAYKMGHGSENFFDLQYRAVKTLIEILKKDDCKDIILVAHSGVLRALSNNLENKDVSWSWEKMRNGEVRIVECTP